MGLHAGFEASVAEGNPAILARARLHREDARQFGVARDAMVALPPVLHDEFPVAALDQRAFERDLTVEQIVRRQHGLEIGPERTELRRILGKADIEASGNGFDMDGSELVKAGIELGRHVARRQELAAQAVDPLVVRADQPHLAPTADRAEFGAAMPAGIVKAAQDAILSPHDEHR